MKKIKYLSVLTLCVLALGYGLFANGFFTEPSADQFYVVLRTNHDIKEIGSMDFHCYDKDGNLKWEDLNRSNSLADEGEYMFLNIVLQAGTVPTNYFLRLFNSTPVDTNTLASLTGEPAGTGYVAQTVERSWTGWPTLDLDSGDYQATSSTETFVASGGSWGPVSYCVLATSTDSSGKLVSYVALSTPRTLASGESLQVTYKLKLQ
jgi:hypothetical protein